MLWDNSLIIYAARYSQSKNNENEYGKCVIWSFKFQQKTFYYDETFCIVIHYIMILYTYIYHKIIHLQIRLARSNTQTTVSSSSYDLFSKCNDGREGQPKIHTKMMNH